MTFLANVNRSYDDQYVQAGAKVGNTVLARLPQRFQVTDGQALQLQSIYDQTVPITLTNQLQVSFGYSSAQATTQLDLIRERYVQPAAEALANGSEVLAFRNTVRDIYSTVGTPGTTPNLTLTYLQAGIKLTDLATPLRGRVAVLDQLAMATIANTASTLFHPGGLISEALEEGQFAGQVLGIDRWYQDPARFTFVTGYFGASTPIINGANQTGSTINTSGWNSGGTQLVKGDIFTIAGVDSVNPLTYQDNGRLQQFVVTATTTDTSGAIAALPISPAIITSGQLQTVTQSPANGASLAVLGATSITGGTLGTGTQGLISPQSLVFHSDCFAFVMADLINPGAGAISRTVRSKELGLAIRWVEQYQIGTDQIPSRLDLLCGAATVQARLGCRVMG